MKFLTLLGVGLPLACAQVDNASPLFAAHHSACGARPVLFHYNDTTLGAIPSCNWAMLNLAVTSLPVAESFPIVRRQQSGTGVAPNNTSCPPGTCTDGPPTSYTIVAGDTLSKIAAQFDSGICNITRLNNISNPNFITAGQVLTVPTQVCDPDNESCITPAGTRPCVPMSENPPANVTIAAGDTFFQLGQRFNVTTEAILAANPCVAPESLQVGQVVKVPVCPECPGQSGNGTGCPVRRIRV